MRDGQYGVCEGCSCSIPMARLNALPYATLCINCQRESERFGKGAGGDADWGRVLDTSGDGTSRSTTSRSTSERPAGVEQFNARSTRGPYRMHWWDPSREGNQALLARGTRRCIFVWSV